MQTSSMQANQPSIILTTGIYDLLKEQIRRRKLSKNAEEVLEHELRHARQVLRRDLPQDVVGVNTRVLIKNLSTEEELEYKLVADNKARRKKGTTSILTPIAIAMLGYTEGTVFECESTQGAEVYKILKVSAL